MHDVISTITRSDRFLLAASLALFAVAGVANTSISAGFESVAAATFAVAGVYGLAQYAQNVSRKRLAVLSLGLWIPFLVIAVVHVVGLETVSSAAPVASGAVHTGLTGLTWTFLLSACAATTFLGVREYAASSTAEAPEEQVLEQDLEL
ncbi:hypothetical protein [Natrononativus amylolyticus]|uniref:hypothetical protein n=1 Tax=Natrononativus amylolyticus TaxID=2963434 RepID=UPI0020CD1259|nr:hypothetical protein [Natrononativus amylolyticus]